MRKKETNSSRKRFHQKTNTKSNCPLIRMKFIVLAFSYFRFQMKAHQVLFRSLFIKEIKFENIIKVLVISRGAKVEIFSNTFFRVAPWSTRKIGKRVGTVLACNNADKY